jgi:DNA replication protein DnaC
VLLQVRSQLDAYVPNGAGLVLHGKVGTGKTHLMSAILRRLCLENGVQARFVDFTHLLSDIKQGYDRGRGQSDVLAPVTQIPVLGIDELGKGLTTDWQASILDEVISRRYNNRLTTYFTTNLQLPDQGYTADRGTLNERIGERIYSRLKQMCIFVHVVGPDARDTKVRVYER